jgi:hypothetical protein
MTMKALSALRIAIISTTLLFTLNSCKTTTVSLQVIRPADINLGDHIQNVVVVNRTYPSREDKVLNILEGMLTGEGIGTDRRATEETIRSMVETMRNSPRFKLVQPSTTGLEGTGTGAFPVPLSWTIVNDICQRSNADALITLEAFDSDSRVAFQNATRRQKNKEGVMVDVPVVRANMQMNITNGWRIYDAQRQVIIDEYRGNDFLNFNGEGPTQPDALNRLPTKMNALMRTSTHVGVRYGNRISPMWTRVSRTYYKKGNDELIKAGNRAARGNWDRASEIWRVQAEERDPKIAARAAYNMAVYCEYNGRPDLALEWADKAIRINSLKRARNYKAVLRTRIENDKRVKEQMRSVSEEQ